MKFVRLATLAIATLAASPSLAADGPQWSGWGDDLFARATAEKRFVILDLEAVWCHWCHVMEKTTYANPQVQELLAAKYLPVRVDQDANPDLSSRYGDWGWPATILFSPDARELGKFRGYLSPAELLQALRTIASAKAETDSTEASPAEPGRDSATVAALPWVYRRTQRDFDSYYDMQHGGWGMRQKAPLGVNTQFELVRGAAGEPDALARALFTLKQQSVLIDPVWGGIYQYSVGGDWLEPHFEKLMPFQASNLEAYALAFQLTEEPELERDARAIADYVARFLTSPEGTFYVSQDADVGAHEEHAAFVDGHVYYASNESARLKLGIPDVDQHVYAAENGLMIAALCALFEATQNPRALASARRAADAILASHLEASGRVLHDAKSSDKVHFLADAAALGRALVRLYALTHDASYLRAAQRIATGLEPLFDASVGAYFAHDPDPDAAGVFTVRRHPFEHNVRLARFLNALSDAAGDPSYRARAQTLLAALSTPAALDAQGRLLGEYLLALRETGSAKKDAAADARTKESLSGH